MSVHLEVAGRSCAQHGRVERRTMGKAQVSTANRGPLITESGFSGYDHCFNPYVGCSFGCSYCYVRFFIKDDLPWGDWVRVRKHVSTHLAKQLAAIGPTRLVIGTMTDPYMPEEIHHRITRTALEIILKANPPMLKVGIFTRSPLALQDLNLISKLPKARIHYTISPLSEDTRKWIERVPIPAKSRWATIKKFKQAGVRVHVNVAPALPTISETLIDDYAKELSDAQVDEFFVDPVQPYEQSLQAMRAAAGGDPRWAAVEKVITDRIAYRKWKKDFQLKWEAAWRKVKDKSPKTMPLMCDHETKMKVNMNTGEHLDWKKYDSYEAGV